jgi:thiosulfate dehydrogenase (quinone) large subunit
MGTSFIHLHRSDHRTDAPTTDRTESVTMSSVFVHTLAATRIAAGFIFLWAFLDKTFGFGFATPSGNAWIDGGSPTKGFLSSVDVGPLDGMFHSMAGNVFVDWAFMLGLLGIGIALMLGIGLRIAAVAGVVMMALMWAAEWPLSKSTSTGEPSGSTNPIVDYHVIYALVLVLMATADRAATTWGLGAQWRRIPFVGRHPVLW